ncbi:hypothetical protein [Reichenbachiella sp.]|uniref:hypothetical protein n=1 Tax=Reichenbachiella sp. TaxID=2184521 RepID=UPI003298B814
MKKANLENVFGQLSNVDNIDEILRDEGLVPDQIVDEGIKRLKEIQSAQVSKERVIDLLKVKMTESITSETKKAVEALKDLIPIMNDQQVSLVFRSLGNLIEMEVDFDQLVRELQSDTDLQKIMKKYNPDKES